MNNQIGPNIKKLIVLKMSLLAIPAGSGDRALELGVQAITNLAPIAHQASEWVRGAIAAVRSAPDCTYTTDEEIASVILRSIQDRETASTSTP